MNPVERIKISVEAVDREWKMGRDVMIEVDTTCRMDALFKQISEMKNIQKNRFLLRIPPEEELLWEQGNVSGKAEWSVRRCGIYDGLRITVEPVFPLAWLWESPQYYEDLYMDSIAEAIQKSETGKMTLQEIALATSKPPPIFMTLRSFLRKYPEVFQLEVNQNNNSGAGLVYIRMNIPEFPTSLDGSSKKPAFRRNLTGTSIPLGTMCPTTV